MDRNSRAVSAKDKHISPTKQCVSVSMSYTKQTGIKLLSVRLYSHKLIALRDLICVGMSQKNKKQSLGGTMEDGVGGERMEGFTD